MNAPARDALRISLPAALLTAGWVLLSYFPAHATLTDPASWLGTESVLGLLAATGGGLLLFLALRREFARRDEAQRAQAVSGEQFRVLFNDSPDAIGLTALEDGRIIEVNPRYCALFGRTREELVGHTVLELGLWADPGDRAQLATLLRERGRVVDFPTRFQARDGSTHHIRISAELVQLGGRPVIVGINRDVTERVSIEAALRASDERYRALVDNAPTGIFVNLDNQFAYVNAAFCRIVGASSPEQLLGKPVFDRYQPEFHDTIRKRIASILATGESVPLMDQRYVRMDGTLVDVETTATPITFQGRRAFQVLVNDITRRKLAEQRQAAFATLGRLLNSATDASQAASIIVGIADNLFGWDSCKLDLYDAQSDRCRSILTMDVINGERQEVPPAYSDSPPSPRLRRSLDGLAELILREPPLALTPDRVPFGDVSRPSASLMSVPLREDGQVVGVLSIQSYRLHAYTNEDLAVLQDLADHCSGALKRIGTQAALRTSEEFNRRLIDSSQDCIKVLDLDGKLLSMSTGGQRLLEIKDISRYLNSCWISFWQPEDQARVREAVDAAIAGGAGRFQAFCKTEKGNPRWWDVIITPIFGLDGKVQRLLSVSRDITAEHEAETELHRSQKRQAAFATLGRQLSAATDETEAARIIVGVADDLFGWDSSKLDLYDAAADRCRPVLAMDVLEGERKEVAPTALDLIPTPRLRRIIESGALLILREEPVAMSPDSTAFGDLGRPSASIMSVPVRESGQVVGVLSIQSYRVHAYTQEDLAVLQDLADHCAGALERIRGRTELERQRTELELILDMVPGIIFYKDRNHRLVRVNEAHARALGLPRSAIEGRTDAELGSPHSERHIRDDDEVMRTGQPKMGIIEPMHSAAGTRWLQTDKLPYRDEHGNIIGILGFALDITARKQAEEALRESEEHHRLLIETTHDLVQSVDEKGCFLFVNRAWCAALGWTPEEARRLNFCDVVHPDMVGHCVEVFEQLKCGRHFDLMEVRFVSKSGREVILEGNLSARFLAGQFAGTQSFFRDITERKHAEQTLQRQHALLSAVVEGTSDAVFAKDLEGRYLIINIAGAQALGRPTGEIVGHTDVEFVPEATARRFREVDAAVIASGQMQVQEESGLMGGEMRHWHANKAPLRDADGRIIGVIGVSRDITEHKRAEAERARLWSVIEASLNEIYVFDSETLRFEYVNGCALRNLGYSADAMRRLTPLELKPQFNAATFAELVQPLRRHEREKVLFQTEHRRADGSRYPVEVHLQLVERGGRPVFLAVINDITERRRAEESLRESEENFQNLFEASPDAIIVATRAGVIHTINQQAERLFGYPRAELVGQAIELLMPSRFHHAHVTKRENYVRDPHMRPMGEGRDLLARRKDGTELPVDISLSPIATAEGVMVISTIRDITKRKLAESALRASEARLEEAQRIAHVGSWEWVAATDAATFSKEFCAIMGLDPAGPLPCLADLEKFYSPETVANLKTAVEKAMREGTSYEIELESVRADGSRRWQLGRGERWFDEHGQLKGLRGTALDITERKLAEQQLAESGELLRALLARLRLAREEERIRVAREIHDELGQLLTGLKMDVRWLERKLSEPGLPPGLNPLLDRAVAASELADSTIATVQKIASELRSGALDQLGLEAALTQEARRFQERAGIPCTVVVAESWPAPPPEIANELFYICQEALTNVTRHARAMSVAIALRTEGGDLLLEVRDDGVGMDDVSLHAPSSLGLTGMRERAVQCGGTVAFERNEPGGTCVVARVPMMKNEV